MNPLRTNIQELIAELIIKGFIDGDIEDPDVQMCMAWLTSEIERIAKDHGEYLISEGIPEDGEDMGHDRGVADYKKQMKNLNK